MELFLSYFKKNLVCEQCHGQVRLFTRRKLCSLCSKYHSEHYFCSKCLKRLIFKKASLKNKEICTFCNELLEKEQEASKQVSLVSKSFTETTLDSFGEEIILPTLSSFLKNLTEGVALVQKDPLKEYQVTARIGSGFSSTVFRGYLRSSGEEWALKRTKYSSFDEKKALVEEIGLLKMSKHPNVIRCGTCYEYKK